MPGYWRDAEATARALRHGWLWTGDIGVMDEDGFLTITDRSKDLVISGGSNIYPREIEEVLQTEARLREVSVIGLPDPEWGEIVVACIVEASPVSDARSWTRFAWIDIARFKRPKRYVRLA